MEVFLEFIFTMAIEIVDGIKFKRSKTRTWTITFIYALSIAILPGAAIWGAVELYCQGSIVGTIVVGAMALVVAVIGLIFLIRGHRKQWKKY